MDMPRLPADREAAKAHWNESYVLTRSKNLWGDPPVPFVADAIAAFTADGATTVLDLPCGDGRNLPPLARAFPAVHGADCSRNALALAGAYLGSAGIENVTLQEADIYATGFPDGSFDGVFCCDVIGHLTDPVKAVRELLRICRPGHCLVANLFAVGDSTRGQDMVAIGDDEYLFDDRIFYKYYDRDSVDALMHELGVDPPPVKLVQWMEPPHEGYREYDHAHESWLFVLRKG